MRIDQDDEEISDSSDQINTDTESHYSSSNPEKLIKRHRAIGYEQTDIRGSRDDFRKNSSRIVGNR